MYDSTDKVSEKYIQKLCVVTVNIKNISDSWKCLSRGGAKVEFNPKTF